MESCNKIMAYGFVVILFLLIGFYWFIIIFSEEIRGAFHVSESKIQQQFACAAERETCIPSLQETHLLLPAFVLGTAALAVLNIVFAVK